ncbi:hypothetical protein [Spirochaeta isovalerica]|uniref:Uncharacterized protein n=1 Tax=Spirochaeta isovalerica TaxID=150 RepID=A0A841R802_9SPIO|nr:hypothetical protein [Spirochaeta isovalerica]MBB6479501.1 hypothetical protein [Spirochaeta isovalerica]
MSRLEDFIARWLSRSGDATFWSWVITFLYAVVIILSFLYTRKIRGDKPLHLLWMALSTFLLAMGVNKQLDFQTLLIMGGRYLAWKTGFIRYGWVIQMAAGAIISSLCFAAILYILIRCRSVLNRAKTALAGTAILLLFLFIRIGSITGLRTAMILQYIIFHIHALELLGLTIIFASLIYYIFLDAKKEQLPHREAAPEL